MPCLLAHSPHDAAYECVHEALGERLGSGPATVFAANVAKTQRFKFCVARTMFSHFVDDTVFAQQNRGFSR
jgi:hypothetical protein